MARQRFIWPSMWTDKTFGSLTSDEKLLFISLFSLADDEGRISGEPMFLKASTFPYDSLSVAKVTRIRDAVVSKMPNVRLYEAKNETFIALVKWHDHQKPKYPKASTIPPPFPERSGKPPGTLGEASGNVPPQGWVGLDRDGKGRAVKEEADVARTNGEQPSDALHGEEIQDAIGVSLRSVA